MKIIEKDILSVESGIICQQVNCQKVMGSGLAKSIREKWPVVYDEYIEHCKRNVFSFDFQLLGGVNMVWVGENLQVFNIFGQLNYGYDKQRYTDYSALNTAFSQMRSNINFRRDDIYFPFHFGCDRGGANWLIVIKMIEFYFPNAVICKLSLEKKQCAIHTFVTTDVCGCNKR